MLTSAQSIIVFENGRALPDRLTRARHGHYLGHAERMLAVYRSGIGQPRRDLHRSVQGIFAQEPDCETRRIQAFWRLLDDAGEFETDPHGNAAELRLRVFALAAPAHPLVRGTEGLFGTQESEVKSRIARELGRTWDAIDAALYADVMDLQPLKSFKGYPNAEALLSRYNVAQVQASLYRAERMVVSAHRDFKTVLRYAKLARLLHDIRRVSPDQYRIEFSGPLSVLSETRRYGVSMARFLPALLACREWEMEAILATPWKTKASLRLSSRDGLRGHLPPPDEFDSDTEALFAEKFGTKRDGWTLLREPAILHSGQTTFVPDFAFRHDDGTEALFEIVGFWTPEYLEKRRQTLRLFSEHKILLAVPQRALRKAAPLPENVITYKTSLQLAPVLEALSKLQQNDVQ